MKHILLSISFTLIILTNLFSQETIYIEANEFGRGIVKPRAAECFAIVPLHIVEDSKNIEIIGEKNAKTQGELIQATTNDLAILRTTGKGLLYCEDWNVDEKYDRILENATEGVLKIRQNDGGIKWIKVDISEFNEANITIEPRKENKTFSKGMSGSALFTDVAGEKVCLGLLMEINSNANEGYVLQTDDMLSNLQDFFDLETTKSTGNKTGAQKSGESSIMNSNYPVFTEDNLSIQLESCKQTGNKVKCELVFLSEEKDLQLYFYGSLKSYTKFYDEQGNKFKSSLVKIANNSNSTQISTILIADIPIKGFVSFDVEREIQSISKIELYFKKYKGDHFYSTWRNVQVE